MTPPEAEVLDVDGPRVTIRCPHCQRRHVHVIRRPGRQRFAPRCGLTLNPDARAAGYVFAV